MFEIAAGSTVGTEHLRLKKNNQDAFFYLTSPDTIIGVVCDGCGSQSHSEVGAKLGASLLASSLQHYLQLSGTDVNFEKCLQLAQADVLAHLRTLVSKMATPHTGYAPLVCNYFLFTVIGFVVTKDTTWIFSLGDGVTYLNGEARIQEFEGNAPPYLGYNLLSSHHLTQFQTGDHQLDISVDVELATNELQSLMIGTDGAVQLAQISDEFFPGKRKQVGPISQFWEKNKFFTNKDMIRRTLFMINRETVRPNWETHSLKKIPGLLEDDTTLIVVRRGVEEIENGPAS
jgi:Protein phosphatase 2C